ncbi:MAG: MazG nucleotide pyrophosphohydrolase domain-containing protein [Anaerolineae bacterium]
MTDWQVRAAQFAQKHNLTRPPGVYALDLLSELGEAAKEILLATEYGERPFPPTPANAHQLGGELGDALYSLCLLAESAGVNLEEAFTATLQKYEQRWQTKKHLGSAEKPA